MSRPLSIAKNILLIVVVAVAVTAAALYLIGPFVEQAVIPPPEVLISDWLAAFQNAVISTFIVSTIFVVIWYALAEAAFSVTHWRNADRRLWWLGIGILCVVVSGIVGSTVLPEAQAGADIAYLLFFGGSALLYYIATALFSPAAFKYTAWGARLLRPRWL